MGLGFKGLGFRVGLLELFKGLLKGPLRLKDPGAWDASEAACHVDLGGEG